MLSLLPVLVLAGCASPDKSARSAEIMATGQASLENYTSRGLKTTRIFALKIDGELLQAKWKKGVYSLSSGLHEVRIICQFSRFSFGDLVIDAGDVTLRFEAEPKTRYRILGQKLSETAAEIWIENVMTGVAVTSRLAVQLNANPQNIPIIIPIPIRR